MKKTLIIAITLILFCTTLYAKTYVKGTHYMILDMPYEENTVWEVYSVFCPYCMQFDKFYSHIADSMPGVNFEQIYYDRYGQYGKQSASVLAVTKYLDQEKYDQLKDYYFKEAITKKGRDINGIGDENFIAVGLGKADLTQEEYNKAMQTPAVKDILDRWSKLSAAIVAQTGSIPAFVVNGKYLINMSQIKTNDDFMGLIRFLLTLKDE